MSNNGYVNRLNQQAVVIKLYKDKKYVQIPTGIRVFNGENISMHTLEIIKKLLLQYEFALYEYYEANNYPNLSLKDAKLILTSTTIYSAKFVEFAKELGVNEKAFSSMYRKFNKNLDKTISFYKEK